VTAIGGWPKPEFCYILAWAIEVNTFAQGEYDESHAGCG